eukprot:3392108-Pleurochrysis_carterae.AAC.2
MQPDEDSTLGLGKDRGATMLKLTSSGSYLRLRVGALRQQLRQRHGVEGGPAGAGMKILKNLKNTIQGHKGQKQAGMNRS